jgi:hypothetical protein
MKAKLVFECGEMTCATTPGKFCRFLLLHPLGGGVCRLFDECELYPYDSGPKAGWVARCSECLSLPKEHP